MTTLGEMDHKDRRIMWMSMWIFWGFAYAVAFAVQVVFDLHYVVGAFVAGLMVENFRRWFLTPKEEE